MKIRGKRRNIDYYIRWKDDGIRENFMWIKEIRKRFEDLSLAKKMLLVYLILLLLTFVISITALQASFKIYDQQLYEKSQQELDFFSQRVNSSLEGLEQISMAVATDAMIQEQLAKMQELPYSSSAYYYELQELRSMLQNKIGSYSDIKNVVYTDGDRISITVGTAISGLESERIKEILDRFHEAAGSYVFFSPTEKYPYLVSGRDIREIKNASLDYMGSLMFSSDVAGILKKEAETLQAEHSDLYVYTDTDIIYREGDMSRAELPDISEKRGYKIINQSGTKMFLCYEKSEKTGWMYVNIFPYSEIFGKTWAVRVLMFGSFIGLFLISIIALRILSRLLTKPLEQFQESIRIVENGDFQVAKLVLKDTGRKDEVGILTREFKVMLDKIDTLIYENYEKQLLLKDTKYKMLQAQINPHFLYNTLNTLNWMVRGGKNADVSKMILELGKLLRAAFAKESYTTVQDEIRTVESYMAIQKFRYQNRVEFETYMSEDTGGYMVPRMILQPLVENSIYYGVDKSLSTCVIRVRAEVKDTWIVLSVEDNGSGMEAEELEEVRKGTITPKGHGIGLKNIRERMKMAYEDSGFVIESRPGEGTRIEIWLPKQQLDR